MESLQAQRARIGTMNHKMRKLLICNGSISRFMERTSKPFRRKFPSSAGKKLRYADIRTAAEIELVFTLGLRTTSTNESVSNSYGL